MLYVFYILKCIKKKSLKLELKTQYPITFELIGTNEEKRGFFFLKF